MPSIDAIAEETRSYFSDLMFVVNPKNVLKYFKDKKIEKEWETNKQFVFLGSGECDSEYSNSGYLIDRKVVNAQFDRMMYQFRRDHVLEFFGLD